jgi:LacI family transcriptional regulator
MGASSSPNLLAVAKLAGVSSSTVSRALRGHPLLSAETVERVQAAARKLGYNANPIISDVMRRVRGGGKLQQLGTIAYLTLHDSRFGWRKNPTYSNFLEGAKRRAQDLGFLLEPIWAREPHLTAARLTSILKTRGIAGVIVGPRPALLSAELLDWSQFSIASVGVPLPGLHLHQAGSHHMRLMEHLLAALEARGYRRIGLALLEIQMSRTERGWLNAWAYCQANLPAARRVPLLGLPAPSPKPLARWLKSHRPDVVIGLHEVLDLLLKLGTKLPRDLGFAHLSRPGGANAPAGMDQKPREIGAAAVDLVVNQIFSNQRGIPATPSFLLIEGEWREGWTARALPA